MAGLHNTGRCAIIVPGMDVDTGLLAPGAIIMGISGNIIGSDFIQGCAQRGELSIIEEDVQEDASEDTPNNAPGLDELRAECEALGIEPSKRWSRETLEKRIAEKRAE